MILIEVQLFGNVAFQTFFPCNITHPSLPSLKIGLHSLPLPPRLHKTKLQRLDSLQPISRRPRLPQPRPRGRSKPPVRSPDATGRSSRESSAAAPIDPPAARAREIRESVNCAGGRAGASVYVTPRGWGPVTSVERVADDGVCALARYRRALRLPRARLARFESAREGGGAFLRRNSDVAQFRRDSRDCEGRLTARRADGVTKRWVGLWVSGVTILEFDLGKMPMVRVD